MVKQSVSDGMPEDFYSIDLMNAYEQLGKILGEAVEDDLVNEIFSVWEMFCMGKIEITVYGVGTLGVPYDKKRIKMEGINENARKELRKCHIWKKHMILW